MTKNDVCPGARLFIPKRLKREIRHRHFERLGTVNNLMLLLKTTMMI